MEHFKEISQSLKCVRLGLIFYKKVHEGIFKNVALNCTINKDVCKRTCLLDAFMKHLIHFWLGFLGFFFRWGVQSCTLCH